ncbi:uncharacterized protein EV422DRAFT_79008 [Fimicolochytrium jonesii]|uniref:uncharacterized protein n=1 Tax=Fimicolochytrium jonesii TaxID=1396493 RepID=UPI0022FF0782|nr:uncharacterized protein EV422DRAFT_79008 [Fimicolochytrium jonesii]KAI8820098.1 hypothetical protein EV422DRAFT_79008 [Fimicolochytrium jonesii]
MTSATPPEEVLQLNTPTAEVVDKDAPPTSIPTPPPPPIHTTAAQDEDTNAPIFPLLNLPLDLFTLIFSYLPFHDIVNLRSVCHAWSHTLIPIQYHTVLIDSLHRCTAFIRMGKNHPQRLTHIKAMSILQYGTRWFFNSETFPNDMLALLKLCANLDSFAYDSMLRGPKSLSMDTVFSPMFFMANTCAIIGERIEYVHFGNDWEYNRQVLPWFNMISESAQIAQVHKFFSHLPNLTRMATLFLQPEDRTRLTAKTWSVCLPPTCTAVALGYPDHPGAYDPSLECVPDFVTTVHVRGISWAHGAVADLARPGRVVKVYLVDAEPERWQALLASYAATLGRARKGAVLHVYGAWDTCHEEFVKVSHEAGGFETVEMVGNPYGPDEPFTLQGDWAY